MYLVKRTSGSWLKKAAQTKKVSDSTGLKVLSLSRKLQWGHRCIKVDSSAPGSALKVNIVEIVIDKNFGIIEKK